MLLDAADNAQLLVVGNTRLGHGSVPLSDRSRTNAYTTPAARSYWSLNPTTTLTFDRMVVFRSLPGQAATPVPGPAAGNAASTTLRIGGVMADDASVDRVRPNPLRWVAYAYGAGLPPRYHVGAARRDHQDLGAAAYHQVDRAVRALRHRAVLVIPVDRVELGVRLGVGR